MPVIVVSAFSPSQGARAVDALAEGAFDLVAKPAVGESLDALRPALVAKVKAATSGRRRRRRRRRTRCVSRAGAARSSVSRAVLIATSTGGPKALAALMPKLPAPLGIGTLIVQHMPPGFTKSLAARLDQASALESARPRAASSLDPRVALIAPGRQAPSRRHRRSREPDRRARDRRPAPTRRPDDQRRGQGLRRAHAARRDDRDGQRRARAAPRRSRRRGGRILVEAESTCTVYGMPRAVEEAKLADEVLPLHELAAAIAEEAAP